MHTYNIPVMKNVFQLSVFAASALTFASCASISNVPDDDVYVVKSAAIPADESLSDETSYAAFKYKKDRNTNQVDYEDDFFNSSFLNRQNRFNMQMGYNPFMYTPFSSGYSPYGFSPYGYSSYGYGMGFNPYLHNPYGSQLVYVPGMGWTYASMISYPNMMLGFNNYGGYYGGYYDPFFNSYHMGYGIGAGFGYGGFGMNPYGSGFYDSWYYGGGNFNNQWGNGNTGNPTPTNPNHHSGPRGSSSGGGVVTRTNLPGTVKMGTTPVVNSKPATAPVSVVKPVGKEAISTRNNGTITPVKPTVESVPSGTLNRPGRVNSTGGTRENPTREYNNNPLNPNRNGNVTPANPTRNSGGSVGSPAPTRNSGSGVSSPTRNSGGTSSPSVSPSRSTGGSTGGAGGGGGRSTGGGSVGGARR